MNWNNLELPDNNVYFKDEDVVIYCADCRDILPLIPDKSIDLVLTDPPWPGCKQTLPDNELPDNLFNNVAALFPRITTRAIIILGCDSDPRFLRFMPVDLPFFTACWLRRIPPTMKGYIIYSGEIAYIFGHNFANDKRHVLLSTDSTYVSRGFRLNNHPAPRNEQMMQWLIGNYTTSGQLILEPFLGSGTTLAMARVINRKCIGIEIEEKYCEIAVERLAQSVMKLEV